jgi:hypothetical protein
MKWRTMLGKFAAFRAKIVDNANGKCGHMAASLACRSGHRLLAVGVGVAVLRYSPWLEARLERLVHPYK